MTQSVEFGYCRGATLIEAMVAVSIMALLAVLAAPSMSHMLHTQRLEADTSGLLSALALARAEAIKTGQRVVLCKGSPQSGCSQGPDGWHIGWMVFVDANNNALRDASLPAERLLVSASASRGARITGNTPVRNYVSYSPMGYTRRISGALQMGTITLCRADTAGLPATELVISSSGRVRIQRLASFNCPSV